MVCSLARSAIRPAGLVAGEMELLVVSSGAWAALVLVEFLAEDDRASGLAL